MSVQHDRPHLNGFYLTIYTWQRKRLFADHRACELLLHVWLYNKYALQYKISSFVVMPDHLHMLFVPEKVPAAQVVRKNAANFTRFYHSQITECLPVWDDEFLLLPVHGAAFLEAQTLIETNPVRAGIVSSPTDYPYSSSTIKHEPSFQWSNLLD